MGFEQEDNPYHDFNPSNERINYEQLLWLQINRISLLISSSTFDTRKIDQINRAIEALEKMCAGLKDDKYKEAIKLAKEKYEKQITGQIIKHNATNNLGVREHLDDQIKKTLYAYRSIQFDELVNMLTRQGKLFKQFFEGEA